MELDALTAAVAATALDSDDGEEDNGSSYHVPASTQAGPFYVVTHGLQVGIFAGWWVFFSAQFIKPFLTTLQGQYLSTRHWHLQCCFLARSERSHRPCQDAAGHRIWLRRAAPQVRLEYLSIQYLAQNV